MSYLFDATGELLRGTFDATYNGHPKTLAFFTKKSDWDAASHEAFAFTQDFVDQNDQQRIRNNSLADTISCNTRSTTAGSNNDNAFTAGSLDNQWVGVVATFQSGVTQRRSIYIDVIGNVAHQDTERAVLNILDSVTIGNNGSTFDTSYWGGLMAYAAIWDSYLSIPDITAYLNATSKDDIAAIDPTNLIGFWPLNKDNSTQSNEGVGAGADLTVTGATFSTDDPFTIATPSYGTAYTGWSASNYLTRAAAVYETVPLCISLWTYLGDTLPGANQDAYSHGTPGVNNDRRNVYFASASTAWGAYERATTNAAALTTGGEVAGIWQHVFAEYTSATDRAISVAGANRGTDTLSQSPAAGTETRIGYSVSNESPFRSGDALASISVWDATGMSQADRAALRGQLASGLKPDDVNAQVGQVWNGDAKAIWSLNPADANGGLEDLTGNGHTLSIVGNLSAWQGASPPTVVVDQRPLGPMVIPRPWTKQPPPGTQLDLSHPLAKGLLACWVGDELIDKVAGRRWTVNDDVKASASSKGRTFDFENTVTTTGDYLSIPDEARFDITGELTLVTLMRNDRASNIDNNGILAKYWSGGTDRSYALLLEFKTDNNNPKPTFAISSDGTFPAGTIELMGTTTAAVGQWYLIGGSYKPSTHMKVFVDGVQEAIETTAIAASIHSALADLQMGNMSVFVKGSSLQGQVALSLIYTRDLSNMEHAALADNPWQIFKPRTLYVGKPPVGRKLVVF